MAGTSIDPNSFVPAAPATVNAASQSAALLPQPVAGYPTGDDLIKAQQGIAQQRTQFLNALPTAQDTFTQLQQQQGLPDLQKNIQLYKGQIYNTQQLLNNLTGDINQRGQGTFATQATNDRMRETEGTQINNQLQSLGTALQPQLDAYTAGSNLVNQQLQNVLTDQARKITGFNTNAQQELDTLSNRVARGETLSDAEASRAFDLLKQENDYSNQLNIANVNNANALKVAQIGAGSASSVANIQSNSQKDLFAAGMGFPDWASYVKSVGTGGGGNIVNQELNAATGKKTITAEPIPSGGSGSLTPTNVNNAFSDLNKKWISTRK